MGENLEKVKAIHAVLLGGFGAIPGSPEAGQRIVEHLEEVAEPDFECVMVGPDEGFQTTTRGPEGFLAVWADWLSAFEDYRIVVEDVFQSGDQVVDFVRMTAKTSHGGVPIETEAGALWSFRSGKLRRVEFHLDRELALRSAGLEP